MWTAVALAGACLALLAARAPNLAADSPKTGSDSYGDPLPAGALARIGTTRLRNDADVTFVGFGPDGKTLITAANDNTIRLWDLASGKEIRRFARANAAPIPDLKKEIKFRETKKNDVDVQEIKKIHIRQIKKVDVDVQVTVNYMMAGQADQGSPRVALSPDGKTLAAGSGNSIQLWDVSTGKPQRQIETSIQPLSSLVFSPDGRTLAGRSADNTLVWWAVDTGRELNRIGPPQRKQDNTAVFIFGGAPAAPGMAFSPDGKIMVAAGNDDNTEPNKRSLKFYDVVSGKLIGQLKAADSVTISSVAFAASGKLLAYAAENFIDLCRSDKPAESNQSPQFKLVSKINGAGGASGLVFSRDGKVLVGRGADGFIRFWDTGTGKEVRKLGNPEAPRGNGLFVMSNFAGPEARVLAFSPDGKFLAAAAGTTVRIWEAASGKEVRLLNGHFTAPTDVALSQDGKTAFSWGSDHVVRRWQAANGKALGSFPALEGTALGTFSKDARSIALANADKTVRIHDTTSGKEIQRLTGSTTVATALTFTSDGKVLAARGSDNRIRLFDLAKGTEFKQLVLRSRRDTATRSFILATRAGRAGGNAGPGLLFSPDGRLLVTSGPGGGGNNRRALVIFDVSTGKEIRKVETAQAVSSIAFSPDSRDLATLNADRTITVWEIASGKQRAVLGKPAADQDQQNVTMSFVVVALDGSDFGFPEPVGPAGLAYAPDGRTLVARGADRSVHVWDVAGEKELGQLKGHVGRIETVAVGADGKTLISGADDTTMLVWDAENLMKRLPPTQSIELPTGMVEDLWSDLARPDGARAYRSVLTLASAPRQATALLGERLKPAVAVETQKINAWISQLESDKYSVRKEAAASLLKAGEQAVPPLQKMLASQPELETRKRIEELLDTLTGGTLTAEQLRLVRGVEALERVATPEARKVLEKLAGGAAAALGTREAKEALDRLGRTGIQKP